MLSVHLCLYPSIVCPFVSLSIHFLSICVSIYPLSVHLRLYPSTVCPFVSLSIHFLFIYVSIHPLSVYLCLYPFIVCPFVSTHPFSVHLCLYPSIVCPFVSLSIHFLSVMQKACQVTCTVFSKHVRKEIATIVDDEKVFI